MDPLAAIIRWLKTHPQSTASQVAAALGMDPLDARSKCASLEMAGFLKGSEVRKGTVYEVITVNPEV